jgi:hypothetical protein
VISGGAAAAITGGIEEGWGGGGKVVDQSWAVGQRCDELTTGDRQAELEGQAVSKEEAER